MAEPVARSEDLTQLKRALSSIRELRARLESVERERREPIAIIGIGCRFPGGADSPESFWRLLMDGADLITEVPPDRWDAEALFSPSSRTPGRMNTKWGGFVEPLDLFDPAFFGISPREAVCMDPQQRLILESAYEALEDAGQPLDRWAGQEVGVFMGVHSHSSDYFLLQAADLLDLGTHTSTSTAHSIVANRLSYCFDWRGPSLAVDTACSSSLVAVHLAVQSLRKQECGMALAGGVNLVLRPETTVALSKLEMMAPDGRCKAFDSRADGFVRGEGCGVVVLKRLSDALTAGDPILALIAGSAVNQDGTTNGLTAPNGRSQEIVLRHALADAGADPGDITYVEAHGTGTALGDPIEVEALAEVMGRVGTKPCVLGSVKSNLGHLEGAAGIVGLIKAVLAMKHGKIPPNLHFRKLNPHIALDGTRLEIASRTRSWTSDEDRFAGISSFGFGGTNAHVILRSAPAGAEPQPAAPGGTLPRLLPISARDPNALRELAARFADHLASTDSPFSDIVYTAAVRRSHHEHRLAVVASSAADAADRFRSFLDGIEDPDVATARARPRSRNGPVLVFAGQGPQWSGMGRDLLETEPVFKRSLRSCDAVYHELTGESLIDEIPAESDRSRLGRTDIAQPVLFALQTALSDLWRSWGVEPDAIVGHSVGEIAAAHAAGILSLEDAMRVVLQRGRITQKATGHGGMAAVELPEAEVRAALATGPAGVDVAAVNSPDWTVISGDPESIEAVAAAFIAKDIVCRVLHVEYASHSAQMDAYRGELVEAVRDIRIQPPRVPILSTVRGGPAETGDFDATYWGRNIREPVRFAQAITHLLDAGHSNFIELSPHPVLCTMIESCARQLDADVTAVASLRRDHPGWTTLLASVARLHVQGVAVDWTALHPEGGRAVALPRYPWQRKRYWFSPGGSGARHRVETAVPAAADASAALTLPGRRLPAALPVFECLAGRDLGRFMGAHRLAGRPVLPAAVYLEWALQAAAHAGDSAARISELAFHEPLDEADGAASTPVQLTLHGDPRRPTRFTVHSAVAGNNAGADANGGPSEWTLHAEGALEAGPVELSAAGLDPDAVQASASEVVEGATFYASLEDAGIVLGGAFRTVDRIWRGPGLALARVLPPAAIAEADRRVAILDSALQTCLAALDPDALGSRIAAGLERLSLGTTADAAWTGGPLWCLVRRRDEASPGGTVRVDATLYDDTLAPVAAVDGVTFRPARLARHGHSTGAAPADWFFDLAWHELPLTDMASRRQSTTDPVDLTAIARQVAAVPVATPPAGEAEARDGLETLAAGFAAAALAGLGHEAGEDVAAFSARAGVVPRHARYLQRLIQLAGSQQPDLAADPSGRPDTGTLGETAAALADRHPAHAAAFRLLARCGEALPAVLRGEADPLELLFSGRPNVEELYRDAPYSATNNARAAEAVAAAAAARQGRSVRILEIGAGTGGTTAYVLDRLPRDRTEYVFTDISAALIRASATRFAEHDFVRFETLDIEAPSQDKGQFDVVLAANVIHATRDVGLALENIRRMLAPGGVLVLLETTAPRGWIDLIFGMTEGWWRFQDQKRRAAHPLLDADRWVLALTERGFSGALAAVAEPDDVGVLPQAVLLASAPSLPAGRWAVLTRGSALGDAVTAALAARGATCVVVAPGAEFAWSDAGHATVRPDEAGDFGRLIQALHADGAALDGVIHLWSAETPDLPDPEHAADALDRAGLEGCLAPALLAGALAAEGSSPSRLWLVTAGAQAVDGPAAAVLQAPTWGLGRSLAFQYPEAWGGLVDLDPEEAPEAAAGRLVHEVTGSDGEDEVAHRNGTRRVARLVPAVPPDAGAVHVRPDATYLITGGLGDLGRKLAGWLADQGARSLVLTGRRPLPGPEADDERAAALQELEAQGVDARYIALDVADTAAMTKLLEDLRQGPRPLRGVIHAAAGIDPRPLPDLDAAAFRSMFGGKALGAWALHHGTRDHELDFFVLFSSVTALLGSRDLAHYAAANQFVDALAWHRSALGLPTLAVNWGTWDTMAALSEARRQAVRRSGLPPMASPAALDALARLAADGESVQKTVARVETAALRSVFEARRRSRVLVALPDAPSSVATAEGVAAESPAATAAATVGRTGSPASPSLVRAVAGAVGAERRERIAAVVADLVRAILGMDADQYVDPDKGLFELGMDSLMTVQLKDRLETALGDTLPATLTLNYPNVRALAGFLDGRVEAPASPAPAMPGPVEVDLASDEDAALLAEVGGLSDAESRRLLQEELAELNVLEADDAVGAGEPAAARRAPNAGEPD